MLRCFLECSTRTDKTVKKFEKRSHWHCCMCPQLFDRLNEFRMHLETHGGKKVKSSIPRFQDKRCTNPANTGDDIPQQETEEERQIDTCTECGNRFPNERALRRHFREVHKRKREGAVTASKYLIGVCVDFSQGVFMIRRSFSGISRPVHCQHSTYAEPSTACVTACELNECRGAAVVARLSGHPAFECIHLQSVQYALPYQQPVILTETSLEDLVGRNLAWFKESRKRECLSLKERADEGGNPLIVHFPREANNFTSNRFWYFSIFDGGIHYWCRFRRIIVE